MLYPHRRSTAFLIAVTILISTGSIGDAGQPTEAVRKAVVKVHSTRRNYSLTTPWRRGSSSTVSGSGVFIGQRQILTNYHVVSNSVDASISLGGNSEKLSCTIKAIGPGIDLALLELDDEDVSGLPEPLSIAAQAPGQGVKIQVLGYPKGGDSLSVTEGVVSRIEHVPYRFSTIGLRLQIDAPLNSGNSGGPVVAENESGDSQVIAISFSGLAAANDIGYAIPAQEINRFLGDAEDGTYDGKPRVHWKTQTLDSKELRRWLELPDDATGIRFGNMPIPTAEPYPLQVDDVITHVGEFDVSNTGKVDMESGSTVSYGYAIDQSMVDDQVPVRIIRAGEAMQLSVPVFRKPQYLMEHAPNKEPDYFVHGPLVLGVASGLFLDALDSMQTQGGRNASVAVSLVRAMHSGKNPYFIRRYDRVQNPDEELVVLTKLLSDKSTRDVRLQLPAVISSINGQPVERLEQAAKMLLQGDSETIVIELDDLRRTKAVFNRKDLDKSHERLMEDNGIVRNASKRIRKLLDQ